MASNSVTPVALPIGPVIALPIARTKRTIRTDRTKKKLTKQSIITFLDARDETANPRLIHGGPNTKHDAARVEGDA